MNKFFDRAKELTGLLKELIPQSVIIKDGCFFVEGEFSGIQTIYIWLVLSQSGVLEVANL